MKRFAQFVAGMLVALTAMPVLAVAPCHQAQHFMKCCGPACAMMAKTTGAKVAGKTAPEMTRPVCCSSSSQRAIPVAEQRTTESRIDLVIPDTQVAGVLIVVAEPHDLVPLHEGPPVLRPSRIALCTFLI